MTKMVALRRVYSRSNGKEFLPGQTFHEMDDREARRHERSKRAEPVLEMEKPAFVDIPPPAVNDMAALRSEYETMVGKRPFMGWSAEDLKDKIGQYNRRDMRVQD